MPFNGDATDEHLRKYGVTSHKDGERLVRALCTLVDFEGSLKKALSELGRSGHSLHDLCDALRLIVDGKDG